jgi:hypothetical protein
VNQKEYRSSEKILEAVGNMFATVAPAVLLVSHTEDARKF